MLCNCDHINKDITKVLHPIFNIGQSLKTTKKTQTTLLLVNATINKNRGQDSSLPRNVLNVIMLSVVNPSRIQTQAETASIYNQHVMASLKQLNLDEVSYH